jgi:hypothetical protein
MKLATAQPLTGGERQRQGGAATLVVVMVLLFVVAMMAAYANRNLVFEQRIASNHFRAVLAFETAEAGAEWALSMLNGGAVDGACMPSAANSARSLRQRYLSIADDRRITPAVASFGCVHSDANTWACACPDGGTLVPPELAAATQLQPMFSVSLLPALSYNRPGVVRMSVSACTDLVSHCADGLVATSQSLAQADVMLEIGLVSALKLIPSTPLTARGSVELGSEGLGLHNSDRETGALLLRSGGALTGNLARSSATAGTPVEQAMASADASLAIPADAMFKQFFGMSPAQYRDQPSVRRIQCNGDCSSQLLADYARGTRQIWVEGDLSLASNISLGSVSDPVLIISEGALTLDGPMLIAAVLYARGHASWHNSSAQPAQLNGALLSEGSISASGTADIVYQPSLIREIHTRLGSWVRVPGSWMDSQ